MLKHGCPARIGDACWPQVCVFSLDHLNRLLAIPGTQARDPLAMHVVAGFLFFFHVRVAHGVTVARRCR